MTRDAFWLSEGRDPDPTAFSASWTAEVFLPQLPSDAPNEIREKTVDVKDPKRVYTIYRAGRRHNFQLVVERYVVQLRYGCGDPYCDEPRCFTCRKRLAGSKPLRRYNATSARTLACYLTSQDNPEKGLCLRLKLSADPNTLPVHKDSGPKFHTSNISRENGGTMLQPVRRPRKHWGEPNGVAHESSAFPERHNQDRSGDITKVSDDSVGKTQESLDQTGSNTASLLEEPIKKDPKSFVQNLFGTIAFRMVEWLTPTSLDDLVEASFPFRRPSESQKLAERSPVAEVQNPSEVIAESTDPKSPTHGISQSSNDGTELQMVQIEDVPWTTPRSPADESKIIPFNNHQPTETKSEGISHVPRNLESASSQLAIPLTDPSNCVKQNYSSSHPSREADLRESQITHHALAISENCTDKIKFPLTRDTSLQTESVDHDLLPASPESLNQNLSPEDRQVPDPFLASSENKVTDENSVTYQEVGLGGQARSCKPRPVRRQVNRLVHNKPIVPRFPQSLDCLSLDIAMLLCNILDEQVNLLSLYSLPKLIRPNNLLTPGVVPANFNSKRAEEWRPFIDQSIFRVFSDPDALWNSFSKKNLSFDTQTLTYCMTGLVRHLSPLIFESLWIAAADLYLPPKDVWRYMESAGVEAVPTFYDTERSAKLTFFCLHGLIAALPYNATLVDLLSTSRMRARGMAVQPSPPLSRKLNELWLLFDDVFSDELALRLARRVFASIPVRRQFEQLFVINNPTDPSIPRPDFLEVVLAPLDFLTNDVPTIIDFSEDDRELREKRTPILLIEWARTIILKDWTGVAEVPADGSFGGALAMIEAIYRKRRSLFLSDIYFRADYLADHLNAMEMPVEWLTFDNYADRKVVHLLNYPWLFSPTNLVTYFRSINFARMNREFEVSTVKMNHVDHIGQPSTLMTNSVDREKLCDRLQVSLAKFLVLPIRRTHVLVDAFNLLWRREARELSRPLKIRLGEEGGELGSDSGGVQQEFFRLAIAEALNPDYGTFTVDERTRMTWFQPSSLEPLWKFELIGTIVSLAIFNGLTLPVTFPKALYRKLLGQSVSEVHHIADGWPELASGLSILLEWDEKQGTVEDVFSRAYEFSVDSFGVQISRAMEKGTAWPQLNLLIGDNPLDTKMVTAENRYEYVTDYIQWLTDVSIRPQFEAFKRGFLTCLEPRSLDLFDTDILQSVVEGVQEIDISELRRYTRYAAWPGDATSHHTIKDFWSIVKKYNEEEKKRLLEFVTASDRLPVGGMRNLQFTVQRNGTGDTDGHLPTSFTCYGTLLLPEYSTKEILREKLGLALQNSKGFGFQ